MKIPSPSRLVITLCASCLLLLTACVSDDDYNKAVTQFTQASSTLTQAFGTLISNANLVEENSYIDQQAFAAQPLDPDKIQARDLLTPDEAALRTSIIKTLTDYTTALGSLAAGKPSAQIEADAKKASTSAGTLSTDATKALAGAPEAKKLKLSGPISSAVSAAGEVLNLIEKHRAMNEIRASLKKNDPAITELYTLLGKEATELYQRQQSTLGATGDMLFHDYKLASQKSPPNSAELLQLTDRIKQYRKDSAAIASSDPTKAIDAFQKAHQALVDAIVEPKQDKKQSVSTVIASLKQFATEVQPLAGSLGSLAGTL
jgi:hypothetical protein